jgi:hypothetical protein
VTAGQVVATGNVTGGNISTGGALAVTGIANVTGNINAAANVNATGNVVVVGNVNVTSNISANNISTGNSVSVGLDLGVSGNITGSGTTHSLSGNLSVGSNIAAGNISVTSSLSATTGTFTSTVITTSKFTNLKDSDNYTITKIDNDGTMAANSASSLPTQQAVVEYVGQAASGIGYNQTWQSVTSSRALGTTYTNSTGKPIMVFTKVTWTLDFDGALTATVDGVDVAYFSAHTATAAVNFLVPVGSSYSVSSANATNVALSQWNELR